MRLRAKVAVVIGASVGGGRATVELFGKRGAFAVACDITEPEAYRSVNVSFSRLDVGDLARWRALAANLTGLASAQ
jgi:NAD(P)-dependent dehydrogenase (short-subunit alcohol dehydrogenase family)